MSRITLPFATSDIGALAKSLRGQLTRHDTPPGHVELLNMLARGAGYRNYQHFRAQAAAVDRLDAAPTADAADYVMVERAARHFDRDGRLMRWPAKASIQQLTLWGLWMRLPADEILDEPRVNALLATRHLFGDHALLRRELVSAGLLFRTKDGRQYRRIERKPTVDGLALIRRLGAQQPA